ncbi:MAG TPA: DUF2157 domain-containing protein, partial [Vicinamibacterales bacterium]|nr:DUF2157 domain-containing protein [Vicinamibacterales bacterium]
MDREAAQARLDRIRAFAAELAALERGGIVALDSPQRAAIRAFHQALTDSLGAQFDLDRGDVQRRMSLGMRIASVLGAIALSAAVFLLFYRFWGQFSIAVQVLLLVAAPIVAVFLAEIAHRFDRTRHFVFVAAAVACAAIVMNVAIVGDIFAMTDSPNALAAWAAFALCIGYAYGLRLPVAVGLALAVAFAAGAIVASRGFDWKDFGERPELLLPLAASVAATGVFTADGRTRRYASTYRIVGGVLLTGALWVLSVQPGLSALPWSDTATRAVYQIFGFAVAAAAIAAGLNRAWIETSTLGAAAFIVFLYTKFYQWWWD